MRNLISGEDEDDSERLFLPLNAPLSTSWLSQSSTNASTQRLGAEMTDFQGNISLSLIFFSLFFAGCFHNAHVLKTLYEIYSISQPMFLVFAFTVAGDLLYGISTLIKALGYLITVPSCSVWGISQLSCFCYISVFVALICICRAVAVSDPLRYRCLMSIQTIKKCIFFCLVFSVLLSLAAALPAELEFVYYVNEAGRIGCQPSLNKAGIIRFCAGFVVGLFGFDLAVVFTYCVLHKSFNKYSSRKSMRELKKIVFKITISTTMSYLLCFLPSFVVYSMILLNVIDVKMMTPKSFLYVDAVMAFFAHLYTAILPMALIYSKSLKKGKKIKKSEHISSNVFVRRSNSYS